MSLNKEKSKCCNSTFHVEGSDEGTNHYECDKCGQACDVATKEECKHEPMPYHFEGEPEHNMCGKCFKKLIDSPKQDTTDWAIEFDRKFRQGDKAWHPNYELIKDFIESVRQKAQQEMEENLEESAWAKAYKLMIQHETEAKTRLEISELISKKFVQIQNTTVLDLLEELQKEILSGLSNQ